MKCNHDYSGNVGWCNNHIQESYKCKAKQMELEGWIGVDFDGTLFTYTEWGGEFEFGEPIEPMMDFVKWLLDGGLEVKIFTARLSEHAIRERVKHAIQDHLEAHGLPRLDVTNEKDFRMLELYDDRAVGVKANKGEFLNGSSRGLTQAFQEWKKLQNSEYANDR